MPERQLADYVISWQWKAQPELRRKIQRATLSWSDSISAAIPNPENPLGP